ncbi:MAG TPA: dihydropteroate synthase [Acidimicrobiales bacterium]|nr:dihydropteroate synthase [Acidimicrobiales bacterium]
MGLSPRVMGIVNVTPDSFFPESRTTSTDEAIARGKEHFARGADVVDVGGESTRPGATPVSEENELARVVPVVAGLAGLGAVSVNTQKEAVARAALDAGAQIVNDESCTLMGVAGERGAGYVAMHRLHPTITPGDATYDDVVAEVSDFLADAARRARAAGVGELWLDPGIGFNKTTAHNLALLASLDALVGLAAGCDAAVLVGTSRKRFLGELGATPLGVEDRLEASLASEAWAMLCGVDLVRVHDVAPAIYARELIARPFSRVGP